MATLGFGPRTVDGMEVWEVASILRRFDDTDTDEDGNPVPGTSGGRDLVAERMAYHEAMKPWRAWEAGEGPKPDGPRPEPPRPDPPRPDQDEAVSLGG